jgi:N utilization substance protein B
MAYLYQKESLAHSVTGELEHFYSHFYPQQENSREYYLKLLRGYSEDSVEIDEILSRSAENWKIGRMARTDRSVLRIATWELLREKETPSKVILDEAVEIAKRFGSADSGAFVNGVLDRVLRDLRPDEAVATPVEKAL